MYIAGFLRRATPHLFHPNFRGVPLGLNCQSCGSEEEDRKLIIPVSNFELVQLYAHGTSTSYTDGRTTYDSNTALALRAPRCKTPENPYN